MSHHTTNAGLLAATAALMLVSALSGCTSSPSSKSAVAQEAPAMVAGTPKEAELSSITLSESAERRLGLETAIAREQPLPVVREVGGELMVPPGRTMLLSAPVSGTVAPGDGPIPTPGSLVRKGQVLLRLTPLIQLQRDVRVTYEADAAAAKARHDAAQQQLQRAEQLLADKVGSQRSLEQAKQEARQAEVASQAAIARLERLQKHPLDADVNVDISAPDDGIVRQVLVAPGLQVTSGASLVEVANLRMLWIRVPVYSGEAAAIDSDQAVRVSALGSSTDRATRTARRVPGPPSADPVALSVDLYYEIDNSGRLFRPGERVAVSLPLRAAESGIVIPVSAIVYDANGGTWVYVRTASHQYQRRRVQVLRTSGNLALVGRGVHPDELVVSVGVAEIFGTEFGIGK